MDLLIILANYAKYARSYTDSDKQFGEYIIETINIESLDTI